MRVYCIHSNTTSIHVSLQPMLLCLRPSEDSSGRAFFNCLYWLVEIGAHVLASKSVFPNDYFEWSYKFLPKWLKALQKKFSLLSFDIRRNLLHLLCHFKTSLLNRNMWNPMIFVSHWILRNPAFVDTIVYWQLTLLFDIRGTCNCIYIRLLAFVVVTLYAGFGLASFLVPSFFTFLIIGFTVYQILILLFMEALKSYDAKKSKFQSMVYVIVVCYYHSQAVKSY